MSRIVSAVLLLALAALPAIADDGLQLHEQEIKAGLLYNFLKYTQWPEVPTSMLLCVYGEDQFEEYLRPIAGRTVNQREITLRTVHNARDAEACHLLFIPAGEKDEWPSLRKSLAGKSMLTVSDSDNFAAAGGMIEFDRQNNHIHVNLNTEALSRAHLQVQDRLLKLVTVVHPGGNP